MFKLLKVLKPYWAIITLAVFIILVQVFANLMLPTLLAKMITVVEVILNSSVDSIDKSQALIDITINGGIALGVVLVIITCQIINSYIGSFIAMKFSEKVRGKLFTKTQTLTMHDFQDISTSSLITRTTNDITQMQQLVLMCFRVVLQSPIMLIGGCIMAFSLDLTLPIILISIIPVLALLFVFIAKNVIPLFSVMQKNLDTLNNVTRENLTGVRVIRAFNTADAENKRFEQINDKIKKVNTKANTLMGIAMPSVSLIFSAATIFILYFGAIKGTQIADISALIQYGNLIMVSFIMMVVSFILIPRASASAKRINEILDMPDSFETNNKELDSYVLQGALEFKNVSFKFPDAEEPTISNLSFKAEVGQTLAIIGGTGSGKSTVINLIPRFYNVTSGKILLNGKNIANISTRDLRDTIAIASQKVEMFNGTILENLKYGNQSANLDDVETACKMACAHEFIMNKDGGYEHVIQKGAGNLSGGQKQRLNIARAIVRKPNIFIFDDSFSALDFATDAKIRKNMQQLKDSIKIIVAQRVNTIMTADKIIMLNDGVAVGIGTHAELMKTCTEYKELVDSQTKQTKVKEAK